MIKHCTLFFFTLALLPTLLYAAPSQFVIQGNSLTKVKLQTPISFPLKNKKGVVVVFMSAKCPCSNSHIPELKNLASRYKNFEFIGVHSNVNEPPDLTKKYFVEADLPFAVIQDNEAQIADQFKAYKTPHAFVLNPEGKILYQGGVTNSVNAQYAEKHFLKDALEDISQDKPVRLANGRTLGCIIMRTGGHHDL